MLRKRSKPVYQIQTGGIYQRLAGGEIVETAEVLSVSNEVAGIPHVRFRVQHAGDGANELRILALATFSELFHETAVA